MKKNRILTGIAVGTAAFALALTGCSDAGGGQSSDGDSTAVITANSTEPQNPLIPGHTNETGGGKVVDALWEGLIYYDQDGKTHNGVAESIESEDNKVWTIKIHDDRLFSDGSPVKAENFVKAWKAVTKQNMLNQWWFANFEGVDEEGAGEITGLKVVDDVTFEVTLKEAQADFPLALGYSVFYPLPDAAFDGDEVKVDEFGKEPIGNGPYKFVEWETNKNIMTEANDKYVGDREAKNGGVEFVLYQKEDAAYSDLQAGNLDVLDAIPTSSLASYESDLGDRAIKQEMAVWQSFTIAADEKHFDISTDEGKMRRHALSMAIDRDTISDKIFNGTVSPAKGWFNKTISTYEEGLPGSEYVEYNPDEAKKLWAEADKVSAFDGEITLSYNADSSHKDWVDAVCNSIKETLGVEAHGNGIPTFNDFRDQITDRKMEGAFRTGWQADYPGPVNYYGAIYQTGGSANDGDYSNKEFDEAVNSLKITQDEAAAQELSNKAAEILYEDMPAIPLWTTLSTGGYSERVSNVVFSWNGVPMYYQIEVQ